MTIKYVEINLNYYFSKVDVFVHGDDSGVAKQIEEVKKYPGISKIIVSKSSDLSNP